jgi:hypothetical protein
LKNALVQLPKAFQVQGFRVQGLGFGAHRVVGLVGVVDFLEQTQRKFIENRGKIRPGTDNTGFEVEGLGSRVGGWGLSGLYLSLRRSLAKEAI